MARALFTAVLLALLTGCPLPEGPCDRASDCPPDQTCRDGRCDNLLGIHIPALGGRSTSSSSGGSPGGSSGPAPSSGTVDSSSGTPASSSSAGPDGCLDALACTPVTGTTCLYGGPTGGSSVCILSARTSQPNSPVHPGQTGIQVALLLHYTGTSSEMVAEAGVEVRTAGLVSQGSATRCPSTPLPVTLSQANPDVCVAFDVSINSHATVGTPVFVGAWEADVNQTPHQLQGASQYIFMWNVAP